MLASVNCSFTESLNDVERNEKELIVVISCRSMCVLQSFRIFSIQNFHDIKIFLFIMFVMQNHTVTVYPNVIILRCIVTVL